LRAIEAADDTLSRGRTATAEGLGPIQLSIVPIPDG
jgi:hypothetical protein